jgi:uncharacterized protein (UPF0332 family)
MPDQTWLDKADRYLEAAQILLDRKHYESAVSRAYYAARYAAIHLFLARRTSWNPKWLHDSIAEKMKEQARSLTWLRPVVMSGQNDFYKSWLTLLKYRGDADYELDEITERIAQRSLAFAQLFVRAVKENQP